MSSLLPPCRRQSGLSLVELMVAMTIGLVITGMVATVFMGAKQSARYQEATSRLQENARFAFDLMAYSIRNAGYVSCGPFTKFANVVNDGTSNWWLNLETPLVGYEGGVSTFPAHLDDAAEDTDALLTVGVDASNEASVKVHKPNAAQIDTTQHSIKPGAILVISDCARSTVFQMSGPTNNNNNATNIVHNTGNSVSPGNCHKRLDTSCEALPPAGAEYTYPPGATIMPLYAQSFYIANSTSGNGRSLWSTALNTAGSTTNLELVDGVENMQLQYGEDTDNDGTPDRYVKANAISSWQKIVTVRIDLLMSTLEDGLTSSAQTYWYDGQQVTASDRKLRRSYSSVVTLRNRSK